MHIAGCMNGWCWSLDKDNIWVKSKQKEMNQLEMMGETETRVWLRKLGAAYEPFSNKIEEEGINAEILADSSDEELHEYGATKPMVKRLRNELKKLAEKPAGTMLSTIDQNELDNQNMFRSVAKYVVKKAVVDVESGTLGLDLFEQLDRSGIGMPAESQQLGRDIGNILQDMTLTALGLEALEISVHRSLAISAYQQPDACKSGTIHDGARKDLPQIMDAKVTLIETFHDMRSRVALLVTSLAQYRIVSTHDFKAAAKKGGGKMDQRLEDNLLKDALIDWETQQLDLHQRLHNQAQALFANAKSRLAHVGGGLATLENTANLGELEREIDELNLERRGIVNNANEELKLALEIHKGGNLKERLAANNRSIDHFTTKYNRLADIQRDKDKFISRANTFVMDLNKEKSDRRSWLFRQYWDALWPADAKDIDELIKSQSLSKEKEEDAVRLIAITVQEYLTELESLKVGRDRMLNANHNFRSTLEQAGLTQIDRKIADKMILQEAARTLQQESFKRVGVADAVLVARELVEEQNNVHLMSKISAKGLDVARQVKGVAATFKAAVNKRLEGKGFAGPMLLVEFLAPIEKSLRVIDEAYANQFKHVSEGLNRAQIICRYKQQVMAGYAHVDCDAIVKFA